MLKTIALLGLIQLSLPALAEITGFQDVCKKPELLARLPQYMKDGCAVLAQREWSTTTANGLLILEGNENGQHFKDVYPFPPGSTYDRDGRKITIHPPGSRSEIDVETDGTTS
jgi:hypothetical protein